MASRLIRDRLLAIEPAPVRASLSRERRDFSGRDALVHRICGEFAEMPGLSITGPQAAKLFGLRPEMVARVFQRLIDEGLLRLSPDGRYHIRHAAA